MSTPLQTDVTTTASVVIVVVVVIILVVIVVGVVIFVVIFRVKKRRQKLAVINKLQKVTMGLEIKLKQGRTTQIEASLSTDPSSNAEIPNPSYQGIDQHHDPPSTTNVSQESHIYTVPDTTSPQTDSRIYDTVYSEPIQPSLFTDTVGTPADSEDLQPYAPIYSVPINLPKSDKVLLKVFGSNIREICELGMGRFGKVVLADTVGLSAKDLKLSESDDKTKSTLVAVKKLKSDALNTTKEAFEKEVNFMSRLTDRNIIHILGVCYEDTLSL